MFEGFLNPGLAAGAALAAVPLVIHLLNRQRHRPLEWAAMRFVLAAYRKTRRRAQLENLILLLLRMGAVALLALAVARPFIGRDSVLAPLTESRRNLILILDGSASTGYRENVETVFERELERARALLGELDGVRGDRARLFLAAGAPRLLSARSPEDALAVLATVSSPTDETLDLGAVLSEVATLADEDAAGGAADGLEVRLLSDLQRSAFLPPVAASPAAGEEAARPMLFVALDKLHELGVRVVVEDLGPGPLDPPNVAVEAINTFGPVLGPGSAVEVGVTVASFGAGGPGTARVVLEVDGERQPSRSVDLTARSRAELGFPVVFADAGHHVVTARLEGDALAIDDARDQIIDVPPPLRVLLVNGVPSDDIAADEVGYLRAVLEPPDETSLPGSLVSGARSPFQPTVVTDLGFASGEVDVHGFDVIVLANAAAPTPALTEELEARVAAGAALIVTAGNRMEEHRSSFNDRLVRPDGTGLLPARIGARIDVADRRREYFRASEFDAEHPALAFFADERWRPLLTEVPVWGFLAVEPRDDARTLIRLDDPDKHPLLLERAYDRGRVFLWTSTIDNAWTKLPESPRSLVPLVHELLRYAGRGMELARNVPVGAALVAEVDSFPRELVAVRPDGVRRQLDGEPAEIGRGLWRLPAVTDTDRIGVWSIERAGEPPLAFAVQLDAAESNLLRMPPEELEALHPALSVLGPEDAPSKDDPDGDDPAHGELWRWLAAACLAFLVLESLWGAWIGHRRRIL